MFKKLTSAVGSLSLSSPATPREPGRAHDEPVRAGTYVALAQSLAQDGVPVSLDDCARCDAPCAADPASSADRAVAPMPEVGSIWDGKSYEEYVLEKYGELGGLPFDADVDWETDLAGSAKGGRGRVVVISTGKSDWERDHVDEKDSLAHHLDKHIASLSLSPPKDPKSTNPHDEYIAPPAMPPPSISAPALSPVAFPPSLFSSSLISQADDPEDQTVLVFPDWKVVHDVENTRAGAKALYEGALAGPLGRAGRILTQEGGTERRRSWVLPYRAVVLLCSHKRRDKKCHIAAPLLRAALHTCFEQHGIAVDETGSSLTHLDGPALEDMPGDDAVREAEVGRRIASIEGVRGGHGGEVGVYNINHLGGHRYAGVMLILFPSGAYLSYGRVTPHEIPRVVEDTILQGKIVPGLLRNAVGVRRAEQAGGEAKKACAGASGPGILGW